MTSYVKIVAILLLGFLVYYLIKDSIFENNSTKNESFEIPAPSSIEIRQAPLYPPRTVAPSGPNPPSQEAPNNEIVVHNSPQPTDPYYEAQDSSDIPERQRYPERSFRSPPLNNNTTIAVESGVASNNIQVSSDNSQKFSTDFIQSGGEFMPGIYANDTYNDTNFSAF
jgi:hypothetical protein